MPPVPAVRGERAVKVLDRQASRLSVPEAAIALCATTMGVVRRCLFTRAATSAPELCAASSRTRISVSRSSGSCSEVSRSGAPYCQEGPRTPRSVGTRRVGYFSRRCRGPCTVPTGCRWVWTRSATRPSTCGPGRSSRLGPRKRCSPGSLSRLRRGPSVSVEEDCQATRRSGLMKEVTHSGVAVA